jgi:hypothetical protein
MRIIGHQHRSTANYRHKQQLIAQLGQDNPIASHELRLLLKLTKNNELRNSLRLPPACR